jgi:hypothetical protein
MLTGVESDRSPVDSATALRALASGYVALTRVQQDIMVANE